MEISYNTSYSTVIDQMNAMTIKIRKCAKNSVPRCERSKFSHFENKNDIVQHYQSSDNLQDQLEPGNRKSKTEFFGTYPKSNAKLFDYANYLTENERTRPRKIIKLKKSGKVIQAEHFPMRNRIIAAKREERKIKSAKRIEKRKRFRSVTQDKTTFGEEREAQKPQQKREVVRCCGRLKS